MYDPNDPRYLWQRNVIDEFKPLSTEEICQKLTERSNGFAVLMTNIIGDFNIGTVIRAANSFGATEFFYLGKKRFDRRGATGVHNYTPVNFISSTYEVKAIKERYTLVGLENNIPNTTMLNDFTWKTDKPPCIVVGEECQGLLEDVIGICDFLVEIPSFGSVRSLNVGVAASIAMYDYVSKKTSG